MPDDIFAKLASEYDASTRKPSRSREGHSLTTPFQQDLASDLESRGFTVTSGTRPGDRGSRHASGAALDIRTKDKPTEVVDVLKSELEGRGLRVLDERYVKTPHQTGPHLHVSTDDALSRELKRQQQPKPQPQQPQKDVFASLADEYEKGIAQQPAPAPTTEAQRVQEQNAILAKKPPLPGAQPAQISPQSRAQFNQLVGKQPNAFEQVALEQQAREAQAKQGIAINRDPYAIQIQKNPYDPTNVQATQQRARAFEKVAPQRSGLPAPPVDKNALGRRAIKGAVELSPLGQVSKALGIDYSGAVADAAGYVINPAVDMATGVATQAMRGAPLISPEIKPSPLLEPKQQEFYKQADRAYRHVMDEPASRIREGVNSAFPVTPEQQSFAQKVFAGMGSTVPFAVAGMGAEKVLPGGGTLASAYLGALSNASDAYDDAIRNGADESTAIRAARIGALIGTTEAVGLGRVWDRIGGKQAAAQRLMDVSEEVLQEMFQSVAGDVNAKYLSGYDPDRVIGQDALESGLIAALTAGAYQGGGALASRRSSLATTPSAPAPVTLTTPANIPLEAAQAQQQQRRWQRLVNLSERAKKGEELSPAEQSQLIQLTGVFSRQMGIDPADMVDLAAAPPVTPEAQTAQLSGQTAQVPSSPPTAAPKTDLFSKLEASRARVKGKGAAPAATTEAKPANLTPEEKVEAQYTQGVQGMDEAVALYEEAVADGTPEMIQQAGSTLVQAMQTHLRRFGTQMATEDFKAVAQAVEALKKDLRTKPTKPQTSSSNVQPTASTPPTDTAAAGRPQSSPVQPVNGNVNPTANVEELNNGRQATTAIHPTAASPGAVPAQDNVGRQQPVGRTRRGLEAADAGRPDATQVSDRGTAQQSTGGVNANRTSVGAPAQNAARVDQVDQGANAQGLREDRTTPGAQGSAQTQEQVGVTPDDRNSNSSQAMGRNNSLVSKVPAQGASASPVGQGLRSGADRGNSEARGKTGTTPGAQGSAQAQTEVAPKSQKPLRRNFTAGLNHAEIIFENDLHRDLYDIGANRKPSGGKNDTRHAMTDTVSRIARELGVSESEVIGLALAVHSDTKAQMKGVKHLESRRVKLNLPQTEVTNAPATQTQQAPTKEAVQGSSQNESGQQRTRTQEIYDLDEHPSFADIDRRVAARGEKGTMGQFHRFGMQRGTGETSLLANPELREMLNLPPMPEYNSEGHAEAAAHTADALAEVAGISRSSQADAQSLAKAEQWLIAQGASDELYASFVAAKALADGTTTNLKALLDDPRVAEPLGKVLADIDAGQKPNTRGLRAILNTVANEINAKANPNEIITDGALSKFITNLNKGNLDGENAGTLARLARTKRSGTDTRETAAQPQPESTPAQSTESAASPSDRTERAEQSSAESKPANAQSGGEQVRAKNFLAEEYLVGKDDPRFEQARAGGGMNPNHTRTIRQENLAEILPADASVVYHDTSLASAETLIPRLLRSIGSRDLWVSPNPDLAQGQSGAGVKLVLHPEYANGLAPDNLKNQILTGTGQAAGEFRIEKTVPGVLQGVIINNARTRKAFEARQMAKAFDFTRAERVDGGTFIPVKDSYLQGEIRKPKPTVSEEAANAPLSKRETPRERAQVTPETIAEAKEALRTGINPRTGKPLTGTSRTYYEEIAKQEAEANIPATNDFLTQEKAGKQESVASVKMLLTTADRQGLVELGYSRAEINAMKPDEGARILAEGKQKPKSSTTSFLGTGAFAKFNEADITTIAQHFVQHAKDAAAWGRAMVKSFGESIRPRLRQIWNALKDFAKDETGKLDEKKIVEGIKGLAKKAGFESNADYAARKRAEMENSPEFKRWFGDSVVTEDGKAGGKPLVVYHGTNAGFTEFDSSKIGQTDNWYGKGFYFTPSTEWTFAEDAADARGGNANVIPVYLRIENPIYGYAHAERGSDLVGSAKERGADAVIIRYDPGHEKEYEIAELIVFSPTQIKSAFNRGTFDLNDPNISHDVISATARSAAATAKGLKKLFSTKVDADFNPDEWIGEVIHRTRIKFDKASGLALTEAQQDQLQADVDAVVDGYLDGDYKAANEAKARVDKFVRDTIWETLTALRKVNLVGQATTHFRNVGSNTVSLLADEASQVPTVMTDIATSWALKRPRTATFSTVLFNKMVAKDSLVNGWDHFKRALTEGMTDVEAEQMQVTRRHRSGNVMVDAYINKHFDALNAEDRLFYNGAYHRSLWERAKVQAINEGFKGRKAIQQRAIEIYQNPTAEMAQAAGYDADVVIFKRYNLTKEKSKLTEGIQSWRQTDSQGWKFVVENTIPFDRTPTNIVARLVEASPLGFFKGGFELVKLKKQIKADVDKAITAEQQRQFAQTIGRATTGTILFALGGVLYHAGLLTGAYGASDEDKDKPPGSLKIGRKWVSLEGWGPQAAALLLGATSLAAWRGGKNTEDSWSDLGTQVFKTTIGELPLVEGTTRLAEDYQRKGLPTMAGQMARQFTPVLGHGTMNNIATQADEFTRKPKGFWQGYAEGIPVLRQSLPDNKRRMASPFDPFRTQSSTAPQLSDDVRKELRLHRVPFHNEKRHEEPDGRREVIPDWEARQRRAAQMFNSYSGTMIASPYYRRSQPEQQKKMLESLKRRVLGFEEGEANQVKPDPKRLSPKAIYDDVISSEKTAQRKEKRQQIISNMR